MPSEKRSPRLTLTELHNRRDLTPNLKVALTAQRYREVLKYYATCARCAVRDQSAGRDFSRPCCRSIKTYSVAGANSTVRDARSGTALDRPQPGHICKYDACGGCVSATLGCHPATPMTLSSLRHTLRRSHGSPICQLPHLQARISPWSPPTSVLHS